MTAATSPSDIVARFAGQLERMLGKQKYAVWFNHSARVDFNEQNNRLSVRVPNRFVADWIGNHFHHAMMDAAQQAGGESVGVALEVSPEAFPERQDAATATATANSPTHAPLPAPPAQASSARASARAIGMRHTNQLRHQLENFVVGSSNMLAYTACVRLAEDEMNLGGPLFIHGSCGLGKTHLLQGLCKRFLEQKPNARVLYTTGEQFTNAFISAVRENKLEDFRYRMRHLDLLAVDDVHFIASKEKTQQEFLHSFDQIELCGARVVLASDSHPKMIRQFSEALVSRCVRGLVVQVQTPDQSLRVKLVQALAARRQMHIAEPAARELATQYTGSVREIEGVLTKLYAMQCLAHNQTNQQSACINGMIDIPYSAIMQLLNTDLDSAPTRPVQFDSILNVVTRELSTTREQLLGTSRHRHLVLSRSLVIHLAREMTSMSYPEIAAAMKRSNHSTIITAAQRITRQLGENQPITLPGQIQPVSLSELVATLKQALRRESA